MNLSRYIGFVVGPVGVAAISLLTVPLTAWYFSAQDIGKISMLQIGISFCLLLFSFGLDQAYVREYHDTDNKTGLFKRCISPGLLFLLAVLFVLLLIAPTALANWLFAVDEPLYSVLIAACFLTAFAGRFFSLILRMQERGWAFSISQLMPKIGFLLVLGLFIYLDKQGLLQLLIAHAVALTSVVLLFAWNTRGHWRAPAEGHVQPDMRKLLAFGLPLVISGIAFWGMTSLDRVFLKHYSDYEALGLYAVINSFAGVAIVLQNVFTTIWAPTAYKWHADGVDSAEFQKVIDRVQTAVVLVFSLAGMFSWVLTYLLPEKYHDGQYIIMGCLVYPLLYTLSETTGVGLGIARKSGWSMLAMSIALLINLLGNFLLVPIYGASGAASATALSFLALFILRTELSNRCWLKVPRFQLYSTVFACTALAITHCLYGNSLGASILVVWSGALILVVRRIRAV